jgi:hypothetical protein
MLSATLDVGNDNLERALGKNPLEFMALMVLVLRGTGLPSGGRVPEPAIGRRRTINDPCCWHPTEGGMLHVHQCLLSMVVERPHLFDHQIVGQSRSPQCHHCDGGFHYRLETSLASLAFVPVI